MLKYTLLLSSLIISTILLAQETQIEKDKDKIKISKREAIVLHNHPVNGSVTEKVNQYIYDADHNMAIGDSIALTSNKTIGQVIIESGNFKGDEKEEVFYLKKEGSIWQYAIGDQTDSYDRKSFQYSYTTPRLSFSNLSGDGAINNYWVYPEVEVGDFDGDGLDEVVIISFNETNRFDYQVLNYNTNKLEYELSVLLKLKIDRPAQSFGDPDDKKQNLNNSLNFSAGSGDIDGDNVDELFLSYLKTPLSSSVEGKLAVLSFDFAGVEFIKKEEVSLGNNYPISSYDNLQTEIVSIKNYNTLNKSKGTEDILVFRSGSKISGLATSHWRVYHLDGTDLSEKGDTSVPKTARYHNNNGLQANDLLHSSVGDFNGDGYEECAFLLKEPFIISRENGTGKLKIDLQDKGNEVLVLNVPNADFSNSEALVNIDIMDAGDMDYDGKDEIFIGRPTKVLSGSDFICSMQYLTYNVDEFMELKHVDSSNSIPIAKSSYPSNFITNRIFAVELAELDLEVMTLGTPQIDSCPQFRPLVILESVPHHYDQIDGTEYDIQSTILAPQLRTL